MDVKKYAELEKFATIINGECAFTDPTKNLQEKDMEKIARLRIATDQEMGGIAFVECIALDGKDMGPTIYQ